MIVLLNNSIMGVLVDNKRIELNWFRWTINMADSRDESLHRNPILNYNFLLFQA
jgi:hypothetical protein